MVRYRAIGILLALCVSASSCVKDVDHRAEFLVFGTLVDIQVSGTDQATASQLFARLQHEFQRMHREWHAWEPGDLLELNRAFRSGETTVTTPDIAELIRRSQSLEQSAGGRFNPAIGKLIERWGFHTSEYPVIGPPPEREEIRFLVQANPSSQDIRFEGDRVFSSNPNVQLDFGGIAKGYAVDLAVNMIREAGIDSAIVNAGGDMRTLGSKSGKDWRVGVQAPSGGVAGTIQVSGDLAVFTSGNYARFRQNQEERYPHILDPRTGWPVDSIVSATVIADSGTRADAAATALVVAGIDEWSRVAMDMGIDAVLVIDEHDVIHATPAILEFFEPAEGRKVEITDPGRGD